MSVAVQRRLPIGAEPIDGSVYFRVWAPGHQRLEVVFNNSCIVPLTRNHDGYFSGNAEFAKPGMKYRFRIDGGDRLFPDPASRFQPEGPHGPSQIVDPASFQWSDHQWKGVRIEGQVISELHIGTFTTLGTWDSAREMLPELA